MEDASVQRRSSVTDVVNTPGQRFDGPMRAVAESVYGVDLSHLRVHTDAQARQSAREVGAEAYTSRNHMVFDGAMTRPKVLHEVAHTIQQAAGPVSGNDNGNGVSVSDPHSPEERQAAAMENASAPSAGIQRLVSSVTGPAADQAAGAPVQRMARRSERTYTQRDSDRIDNESAPRTHGRTRAGASSSRRERDPLADAARVAVPRSGPDGERLWDGTRSQLTWTEGAVAAVLASTHSKISSRTRTLRYECDKCGEMVLSKGDSKKAKEDNWYEIDHVEGILAYVHRSVDPMEWTVPVGDGIYRDVTAISWDDARNAASDPSNLRCLCRQCNGGKRASKSESKYMDRYGPQWVGAPYEQNRRSASPEMDYAGPPAGGGSYASDSYGGAIVVTAEPRGQSSADPYGPYGTYGGGYGGGQSSADPGYDVVTAEPGRRRR
ncbi:DUF4157 domain-containing protein [Streptomyces aurantiacus]|uniref:eCIS core domain-containing protein n=1 Tax=Streptomyces aurantiacus TaxID=47760 RepID=UPI0012FEA8C1|nr:DUF4157 domain-containing protein [Streptomyces aurantiacus]